MFNFFIISPFYLICYLDFNRENIFFLIFEAAIFFKHETFLSILIIKFLFIKKQRFYIPLFLLVKHQTKKSIFLINLLFFFTHKNHNIKTVFRF
jgi:hypothetical protein